MGYGSMGYGSMGYVSTRYGSMGYGSVGYGSTGCGSMGYGSTGCGSMGDGSTRYGKSIEVWDMEVRGMEVSKHGELTIPMCLSIVKSLRLADGSCSFEVIFFSIANTTPSLPRIAMAVLERGGKERGGREGRRGEGGERREGGRRESRRERGG